MDETTAGQTCLTNQHMSISRERKGYISVDEWDILLISSGTPRRGSERGTFREKEIKFEEAVFPCCSCFSRDSSFPFHEIQGSVCCLRGFCVESLVAKSAFNGSWMEGDGGGEGTYG